MQQIADWLEKLGLGQYAQRFAENEIDVSVLRHLSDQDLKDIGVPLGHRRKILAAIDELTGSSPVILEPATGMGPKAQESAERRQVTVMFTDLVGSSALSTRLDAEDLRTVIGAYHKCVAETVVRFGGFVAKYMGDGVLIYFGYPQAHEDDAERAVRAGLALIEAVGKLSSVEPIQVRIGVGTGVVVIGDLVGSGDAQERGVVGETPNVAARLQAAATPGTIAIDTTTRGLLGGLFEYRDLGGIEARGFANRVQAYAVVRPSMVESRFEALRTATTPLVGRDEEVDLLLRRWEQAKRGDGCVVLISGEPGIGKSRIAETIVERLSGEPHTRLRYFCSPHHQDSALYPSIAQLERAAGFRREDTAEQRLAKLEAVLAQGTNDLSEAVPLLADLLSIPTGDRYPPLNLTPQKRKEKTLHALMAQLEGLAARQPVLMVVEDTHWSDPTTLELLDLTVDRSASLPMLLLIIYRPEFAPPWIGRSHVTMLTLNRLPRRQGAEMIAYVTGGKALPKDIAEQIIDRTDGVPLFIEELTKTVVESGLVTEAGDHYALAGPVAPLAIPTSLHASLLARLDSLAPTREVAQIGAALGRSFSYELISAVAGMPQQKLDGALDQLASAQLIFRRGTPPDAEYTFKHALVQEAAYATLLRERRRELHARISTVLESEYPEVARTRPEVLARHCAAAGLNTEAIGYYRRAAAQAMAASANAEAIAHLTRGLELLQSLPASPERHARELDFQIALGAPLAATRGWGAPEAEAAYARARQLCEAMGDTPELFQSLMGLCFFHLVRARLEDAHELSQQLLGLAARLHNDELTMEARCMTGLTLYWLGKPMAAVGHLEQALVLHDAERHRGHAVAYGQDPAVASRIQLSLALWLLGYPDQALAHMRAAISHARDIGHAFSLAFALEFAAAYLHHMRREPEAVAEHARALLTFAAEQGILIFSFSGAVYEGGAWSGNGEAPIDQIRAALAGLWATGSEIAHPFRLTLLVRCLARTGQIDEALETLTEVLVRMERTSERWWEAEAHRLMGELLLQRSPTALDQAEGYYRRAVERAQKQGAKSLELRASTSLARLWRDQGKREEARELLAPVYDWFTEGFDTLDLKEARALLDELA